ncbi:MAG: hypothetical protein QOE61_4386 [Micromonosporaceae bacterium]|nr:hypothetical protein [Micromonosporaceae bacterium]
MGMPTTDITALTAYGPRPAVAVTSAAAPAAVHRQP